MTASDQNRVVRTPLSRRLRLWNRKYTPKVAWLCVAVGLLCLWGWQPRYTIDTGIVESPETTIAPLEDGAISELLVGLLDGVKQGQALALLDDGSIKAELATATAELDQLGARLIADQEQLQQSKDLQKRKSLDEQRRFAVNEEQIRLDYLKMLAQQESNKVELSRLELVLQREAALRAKGFTSQQAYDNARLGCEALRKKVQEDEAAIAAAQKMRKEASARHDALSAAPTDIDLERILDPVRKTISVQEARIAEIQEKRSELSLVSPCDGQVREILKKKGESVLAGQPIMTINAADSQRVLLWMDETNLPNVKAGSPAHITSRYRPEIASEGKIIRVGTQILSFPKRIQKNPMVPQYGVELLVGELTNPTFHPGELVNVTTTP